MEFYITLFFVGIIGLCIGSFLNVVVLRAFSGESIILPPSKCPACGEKLKPHDNIPLLSYLMLGGKCRYCKAVISKQYFFVELITALMFISAFAFSGLSLQTLFLWIFLSLFIVISVTDIKEKVIFDVHTYILAGFGVLYNVLNLQSFTNLQSQPIPLLPEWTLIPWVSSVLGLILGALFMELIARSSLLIINKRAFGEGDSYIAGALGAIFGLVNILPIIVLSFLLQAIIVLPVFIKKLWLNKDYTQIYAIALFIGSVTLFKVCDLFNLLDNFVVFVVMMLQMLLFGFYSCKKIMQSAAKDTENLTHVPFGPAMVFAAFLFMFFGMYLFKS